MSLQGDVTYNYYSSKGLNPQELYYKTLINNKTDPDKFSKFTNISWYLETVIQKNFFNNKNIQEDTIIWVGPMQIRQVKIFSKLNKI